MDEHNDFTIDPVAFNDLGSFVDELHRDGRHYVLIVVSYKEVQKSYVCYPDTVRTRRYP